MTEAPVATVFNLHWEEDRISGWVLAVQPPPYPTVRVALLTWEDWAFDWALALLNREGEIENARNLGTDPEASQHLHDIRVENLKAEGHVRPALEAELQGRARMVMEETREIAELGAKMFARQHWTTFFDK